MALTHSAECCGSLAGGSAAQGLGELFCGDRGACAPRGPCTDTLTALRDLRNPGPGSLLLPAPSGRARPASSPSLSALGDGGTGSGSPRGDSSELWALPAESDRCLRGGERSPGLPSSPEPPCSVVLNRARRPGGARRGGRRAAPGDGHCGVLHSRGRCAPQSGPWRRRAAPRGAGSGDGEGTSGEPGGSFSFSAVPPRRVRRRQGRTGRLPSGWRRRLPGGEKSESSERAPEPAEAVLEPAELELNSRLRSCGGEIHRSGRGGGRRCPPRREYVRNKRTWSGIAPGRPAWRDRATRSNGSRENGAATPLRGKGRVPRLSPAPGPGPPRGKGRGPLLGSAPRGFCARVAQRAVQHAVQCAVSGGDAVLGERRSGAGSPGAFRPHRSRGEQGGHGHGHPLRARAPAAPGLSRSAPLRCVAGGSGRAVSGRALLHPGRQRHRHRDSRTVFKQRAPGTHKNPRSVAFAQSVTCHRRKGFSQSTVQMLLYHM